MNKVSSEKIGFGGGCHWCTEAVFQEVKGVRRVEQGFISSYSPHVDISEAVIVHFDPASIELSVLINIHLNTHSSSSLHSMRNKYRSAIYTFSKVQEQKTKVILDSLQKAFSYKIITEVLPFRKFQPSAEEFRDYYLRDPNKPFCQTYIIPKLKLIQEKFPDANK